MKLIVPHISGDIRGQVRMPVSKYHLHRALILGSLADGTTVIRGRSDCQHIGDTLRSLRDFGVNIVRTDEGYRVTGGPYRPRNGIIRVGSSGSTLQFLLGLGCRAEAGPVSYRGHHLLAKRPIGPLLDALGGMGVRWRARNRRLPVRITPGLPHGGTVRMQGTLSQWISGVLMLAPCATAATTVEILEPFNERNYVALTIQMMRQFRIHIRGREDGRRWVIPPRQRYRSCTVSLEADFSSGAFLFGLAALHPANLIITGVGDNSTHPEKHIVDIVRAMGLPLKFNPRAQTMTIRHRGIRLKPVTVDMRTVPDFIPMLSVLGACAQGRTVLRNIGPGRMKESNRVRAMLQLRRMGADISEQGDDLIINGGRPLHGAVLSSYNDHRVQMALAVAGTAATGRTELTYPNAYKISYPEFCDDLRALGGRVDVR